MNGEKEKSEMITENIDEIDEYFLEDCWHTIIVSISETECQCTSCLRIWEKGLGFISDNPLQDQG